MTKNEALKLALEALEIVNREMLTLRDELAERGGRPSQGYHQLLWDSSHKVYTDTAIPAAEAIREALAQPEQEPVAWRYRSVSPFVGKDGTYKVSDGWTLIRKPEKRDAHSAMCGMEAEPLYTTPPHCKPLSDVEIWNTYKNLWMFHPAEEPRLAGDVLKFARAIEAAHGIKE